MPVVAEEERPSSLVDVMPELGVVLLLLLEEEAGVEEEELSAAAAPAVPSSWELLEEEPGLGVAVGGVAVGSVRGREYCQ